MSSLSHWAAILEAAADCLAARSLPDVGGVGDDGCSVRRVESSGEGSGLLDDLGESAALSHDGQGFVQSDRADALE